MRLVQRAMLAESGPVEFAEVFLGGLIRRLTRPDARRSPDEVCYDSHEGVRAVLRRSLLKSEALRVLQQAASYIEERTGQLLDFETLVADKAGAEQLPDIARHLRSSVRRRCGSSNLLQCPERLRLSRQTSPTKAIQRMLILWPSAQTADGPFPLLVIKR